MNYERNDRMKRKKLLALLLSFALIFSLIPTVGFAEDNLITLSTMPIELNELKAGDKVEVSAILPDTTGNGFQFDIEFDSQKFTYNDDADISAIQTKLPISKAGLTNDGSALRLVASTLSGTTSFEAGTIAIKASFTVKKDVYGKSEAFKLAGFVAGSATGNLGISNDVKKAEIKKSPITSAAVSVEQPVKGAVLATTVNTNNATAYTAGVEWFEGTSASGTNVTGKAKAEQIYTAKITLTADSDNGENFAKGAAFNAPEGYKVVSNDGTTVVLTRIFQKTASKSVTGLEITAQPAKKTYTHGDSFDAAGMVVKAAYDDGSEDADFKAYEVVYANEGKSYLKYKDTKVTLKVGDVTAEITNLEVNKKELEITGLNAVERKYDGTTKVSLTGGTLAGAVAGEDVTVTMPTTGTIKDANVGNNKKVAVTKPTLEGNDSNNYLLADLDEITVNILKGIPSKEVLDAIKGYEGIYDGKDHDAVVIGSEAKSYTVKYKTTENGNYETTVPTVKNASEMGQAVMVAVSKENYNTVYMSVTAKILPKELTASDLNYGGTVTKEYDGTVSCNLTKVNATGVNGESVDVGGIATYDNKNVGTDKIVTFKADGIKTGNYRLASDTALEINASITATDNYSADDKFNTQNVVKGIGEFEEPQFVSEFNETVKGTFAFTYNGEAKTKEQIVAELKDKEAGEKASIGYTFTPTDNNYTGTKTGTISITMIDIEFMVDDEATTVDNAITVKNSTPVYGTKWSDIITLKNNINAKVGDRTVAGTYTLSVDNDTIPKAGTAAYNILFTSADGQYNNVKVFTTDASVQVSQKPLTVAGAKAEDRQFDDTTSIAVTGGTLNGVVGEDDVTLGGTSAGTIESADAGSKKAVTVTGYEISGADADNYTLVQPTDVTVNISKKELTLKNVTVADKRFDGTTKATVTKVEFEQTAPLPDASGYTATAEFADSKTGTDKATVKVVLNDRNYSLAENTITVDANITKAAAVTIPEQEIIVKVGDKNKYTVDFSAVMPENAGNVIAKDVTLSKNDDNILYEIDNKEAYVEFYVDPDEATAAGKTGKLMLTLTSDNYEDSQAVIAVKTTNDNIPAVNVEEIKAEYTGQPVSIKATSDIKGIFAWKTGNAPVNVADSGIYEVVFTPDDNAYKTVTKTIRVTITPAKVSGNLEFDKVNTSGKTLGEITPADFTKLNVEGTFTWNDGDAQVIEQGKAYGWTFTPNDENYAVLKGIVTPWPATVIPGGGGFIPPTAEKPEITVDNAQGKVELSADGTTATITPNDGYEIDKITVNGIDKGALKKITGLKTGDKVVVTFKTKTAPEPVFDAKSYVKELKLTARSAKTSKGNIKVTVKSVTDQNGKPVDLAELKAKGYTVKYKFYRSTKKSSKYAAKVEKTIDKNSYINSTGKKGTKYFYKVRVMVYDNDGKLVAKSALKQCKYGVRTWSK